MNACYGMIFGGIITLIIVVPVFIYARFQKAHGNKQHLKNYTWE